MSPKMLVLSTSQLCQSPGWFHSQAGIKMLQMFQVAHPDTTHPEEREGDSVPVVHLWRCSQQMSCHTLLAIVKVTCLFLN